MKRYNFAAIAALLFLVVHTNVFADETYAGVGLAFVDYTVDLSERGVDDYEVSLTNLYGRYGVYVNDNFSIEGRVGVGIGGDSQNYNINGTDVKITTELKSFIGLYGRLGTQANSSFYPYIIAGYTRGKAEYETSIDSVSETTDDTDSDSSFGFGADIGSGPGRLNIEFMQYLDKKETEISGFNISYVHNF